VDAGRQAARRFTEQRDLRRVTTERGDVALDPLECGALIFEAVVAGGRKARIVVEQRGMREESEQAEPIVQRHHDHAVRRERSAVVVRIAAATEHEAAAMQPHHHRQVGGAGGCPHVREQAVLVVGAPGEACLRARASDDDCLAHIGPWRDRLGCAKPIRADRRRRVRNGEKVADLGDRGPVDGPGIERDRQPVTATVIATCRQGDARHDQAQAHGP